MTHPGQAKNRTLNGRRRQWLAAGIFVGVAGLLIWANRHWRWRQKLPGARLYTVDKRIEQFGVKVDARLRSAFEASATSYPGAEIALLAFKDTRTAELYARADLSCDWVFVKTYPVLGASGKSGPKLKEGDRQVPEGIYRIELLNPNSRFHVSLRLDYPNAFDRRMAVADGRNHPGSDIMIHGGTSSIGCLAMGDNAAEELFVLAVRTGKENFRVAICPTDFRNGHPFAVGDAPCWIGELYGLLRTELQQFSRGA